MLLNRKWEVKNMPDNKVLIEVLQGTMSMGGGWSCTSDCASAASCGTTIDYSDQTAQLKEELTKTYGDKVEVKYVDVDKEGLTNYPVMNQVLMMGYPFPITLVNGDPKFAGGIMTAEVKQLIDETLKKPEN